ncbi:FtsX-like permease family protein [Kitasatospora sp. NPDC101801]|uniref:FtsX-like permease family protein n=1 Tax=Kitasatospora sp. NPDC101801 TaxID=3364103 RepID=UPI0037F82396
MKLGAWRVALRIARRDALQAKGRSALVIAMIALPVLGVAGADVVFRSAQLEPEQKIARIMGEADAMVSAYGQGMIVVQSPTPGEGMSTDGLREGQKPTPEQQRSLDVEPGALAKELLPAGAELIRVVRSEGTTATTKAGQLRVGTSEADLTDPIWRGRIDLIDGRAPTAAQELAVTGEFLKLSGLKIGDSTTLRGVDRPFTITAAVEFPGELGESQLIGRPDVLTRALAKANGANGSRGGPSGSGEWLVRLPAGQQLGWPKVLELNKYGFQVTSRAVLLDPPPRSEVPYYNQQNQYGGDLIDKTALAVLATVAGMALLEIVLLAGPAFAVGARRSRRQLGLLAAGGGDRSHVRSVVLGGGMVLGLTGSVVGVALAAVTVAVARPWLEELAGRRFGSFDLVPLDLLGVALIGLATGLLAAVVPAVQASRQDVVEALTGRGSVKPPSRKLALLGLLMLGGGAAIALLGPQVGDRALAVLGGSVIAELGMVACTPMLVGLFGKLGRWLPLSPRLALRDSVRHRGRTAPAVAAVMAAVAGAVAVGIYATSSDQEQRQDYRATLPSGAVKISLGYGPDAEPGLLAAERAALEQQMSGLGPRGDIFEAGVGSTRRPGSGYLELKVPKEIRCPLYDDNGPLPDEEYQRLRKDPRCVHPVGNYASVFNSPVLAGDATALANLTGVRDPAAAQALAQGKVVVLDPDFVKDGSITLTLVEPLPEGQNSTTGLVPGSDGKLTRAEPKRHEVKAEAVVFPSALHNLGAFASPETARRLGLTVTEGGSVWQPAEMPGSADEQKAEAALAKVVSDAQFTVERGYQGRNDLVLLALTGFASIVALGAAGIATGLASADSQGDLTTLAAVGATGGIRRRLSGFQCGVIAAMGALLGTVSGVVPAVALRKIQAIPMDPDGPVKEAVIAFPWLNIGLTLLVLPAVAVLLAMLFTRSRLTLLRRSA